MSAWINGRRGVALDYRDRGLQYGDGVFETMRVHGRAVRLLAFHLERLYAGCCELRIAAPPRQTLRRELERIAAAQNQAVLKLIVTRGSGARGYRPSGNERCTRIISLHALPSASLREAAQPARVRLCRTPLGLNPRLAGLKTLNRLESVLARSEWSDARIWEGLMQDTDGNIVCGTMSNLFVRRGSTLMTPLLDRCGVAGVMRRWILQVAGDMQLRVLERRLHWQDLVRAEEVFMSNAVLGPRSVGWIRGDTQRLRLMQFDTANQLRARLQQL